LWAHLLGQESAAELERGWAELLAKASVEMWAGG